jgi:hypothetical protein
MTRGFFLILVATYLTLVGAEDLQEIKCPGKTENPFYYNKIMCCILNKESGKVVYYSLYKHNTDHKMMKF